MSRATTHTPSALKTQLRRCLIAFSEMQAEYKRPLRCAQLCGISQAWRFGYNVFPKREHIAAIWLAGPPRSEEHTSELQSQSNLVCRLLLEKKKKTMCNPHCPRAQTMTATPAAHLPA